MARGLPVLAIFLASLRLADDEFGAAAVIIGAVTTAALIADSGTDTGATFLASRASTREALDKTIGALVILKLLLSITAASVLVSTQVGLLEVGAAESATLVGLAVLGAALSARNSAHRIALRIEGQGERGALVAEKFSFSVTFLIWALVASPTAHSIVLGYVVASIIGPVLAYRITSKSELFAAGVDLRKLLSQCAPFTVTAICAAVIWRTATFALGQGEDVSQAGYFTLAYYPIQLISSVPVLSAPLLLVNGKFSRADRKTALRTSAGFGILIAAGVIAISAAGHEFLADTFIASEVWAAFAILALALPLLWINPILVASMRVDESVWLPTGAHIVGLIVSLPLLFALIPHLGALGASIAILVGECVVFSVLCALIILKKFETWGHSRLGSPSAIASLILLLVSSIVTFFVSAYAAQDSFKAQLTLSSIVLLFALLTDSKFKHLPVVFRPGLAVVGAACFTAVFAVGIEPAAYDSYLSLWSLQMIGFSVGLFLYTDPKKAQARLKGAEVDVLLVQKIGRALAIVSLAAFLVFVAAKGIPVLGTDIEQGRVDSAGAGTGYLRLVAYMAVPSALLLLAIKDRYAKFAFVAALLVVLALGNRSPLLYLVMPAALLYVVTSGSKRANVKVIAAALLLGVAVSAFGTYRIASQEEFVRYSEYRRDLLEGDYLGVAYTSVTQYAEVVANNAVLTKNLVDADAIPHAFGTTYFTLFITALPGEQLSLDRVIKEASGKSFVGGGTPPTFMGEGYVNFGPVGTVLAAIGLMVAARGFGSWVRRPSLGEKEAVSSRLHSVLYGYVITWFMLCQVAGLAGASTVPLAGFLVLLITTLASRILAASKV